MTSARITPGIALLLAAFALRGAVLWGLHGELARDPDSYRRTAQTLVEQGVYAPDELASQAAGRPIPGAYRPPLYPLLLVALGATTPATSWRIGLLQLVLGLATVALTFVLARRFGLGRWAWLAAALIAVDPLLLSLSAQVMTETTAALLAVAGLVVVDRALAASPCSPDSRVAGAVAGWSALVGALAGLAVLCRPTFLLWALGLPVILAWNGRAQGANQPRSARPWAGPALVCLAALTLAIAPWIARNMLSLGSPILATTHGGYTCYLANNRELFDYLRSGPAVAWNASGFNERWRAERAQTIGPGPWPQGTERAADRLAYERAASEIAADPAGFVRAAWLRLTRLWGIAPEQLQLEEPPTRQLERWVVAAWYAAVLLLTALGLFGFLGRGAGPSSGVRLASVRLAPALWMLASFTALHALYWTNLRMRAPLMPAVAVFAAGGAGWLANRK